MRMRMDHNLRIVAKEKGQEPETVAVEMCRFFIDRGVIEDPGCYKLTMTDWSENMLVQEVCGLLASYLYGDANRSLSCEVFDAFCKLVVIGDGGCPYCGGNLIYLESIGHYLGDGNYWIEPSYVYDTDLYRCDECGQYIEKTIED